MTGYDSWVNAPDPVQDSVVALTVQVSVPGAIRGTDGWEFFDVGAELSIALSSEAGQYDVHVSITPTGGGSIGLVAGTAQMEVFSGTYSDYNSAVNASIYYVVGGGLLFDSQGEVKGFTNGVGFGLKWAKNWKLLNQLRNKGYTVDQGAN